MKTLFNYAERLEKVKGNMQKRDLKGLFLVPSKNMYYLTGYSGSIRNVSLDRSSSLIVPLEGDPIFISSQREEKNVKESTWVKDIRVVEENPYHSIKSVIDELDLNEGKFGIDEKMWCGISYNINKLAPEIQFENFSDVFCELRLIKSPEEIRIMREVGEVFDYGMKVGIDTIEPNVSEIDVSSEVDKAITKKGGTAEFTTVVSGMHRSPETATNKLISKGDVVLIDIRASYKEYYCDESRVAVCGTPDEEQRKVFKIVKEAQEAAMNAVRPGVKAEDVDKVARDFIGKAGYGQYFTHGTGHGIGLEDHEYVPRLVPGSKTTLREGMTHSVEPGIYLRALGKFGMRLEDVVVVTEDGCETLSNFPRNL